MKGNSSSSYDIVLPHDRLTALSDNIVLEFLNTLFSEHRLFRLSRDWRNDKRYILKAKGTKGDVIVGWLENQLTRGQEVLKHCPIL